MRIKYLIPYLLSCVLLLGAVFAVSAAGSRYTQQATRHATADEKNEPCEMRGVWVTYMALDVENEADHKGAFTGRINAIVSDMKAGGFNTMFVQVRPFCDAIYRSRFYPWSHIITGVQGEDAGFDPLKVICDICAENQISVHAWINPYRISTASTPSALCEDHPYRKDKALGVTINGEIILDPANERARELIVDGVIELLENYPVDGVHFDDYFYPENCGDFDREEYEAYCESTASPLSLEDYRKENVNALIREVWQAVHRTNRDAVFGVSPQGNLSNNDVLYADVRRWCSEEGYIDYICPQLYFSLDNPYLGYEEALKEWLEVDRHPGLSFYVGLGGYKAGTNADEGTWLDNDDILQTEVEILRRAGCGGFLLYSSDSFEKKENEAEIANLIRYLTTPTQ